MFCDARTPGLALGSGLQVTGIWAAGHGHLGTSGGLVRSQESESCPVTSHSGSIDGTLTNPLPWKNKRVNTLSISFLS